MVRARLVTGISATLSAAPLATFATTGVRPAERSFGHHYSVHPHGVGDPQARAEVVRIGHPVQQQQEGGLRQALEQLLEVGGAGHRLDPRHDPLVPGIAGETGKTRFVHGNDACPTRLGQRRQLAQPRIPAPGVHVDLAHAVGPVPQPCGYRVKTHQQALFSAHDGLNRQSTEQPMTAKAQRRKGAFERDLAVLGNLRCWENMYPFASRHT